MQIMKSQAGLYVTLEKDGYIKRNLITNSGEKELPRTTIKDEIIEFSELNFGPYSQVVDFIQGIADEIKTEGKEKPTKKDSNKFQQLLSITDELINELNATSPISSLLSATAIADSIPIYDNTIDEEGQHYFLSQVMFKQELTFDGELTARYFFRNLTEYYVFLLMQFLSTKPKITRCECCGRYFVPKTSKATKYCDRVLQGNKTCKDLAPSLKHKMMVRTDKVVEAFDRAKRKMYRRYERNDGKIYMSPKGITYDEFYVWNDAATEARDEYLRGELSEEEALKIIEGND